MATTPVKELVKRANEVVEVLDAQAALDNLGSGNSVLIDVRDIRELGREGRIEDALHVPRGMIEFWFDPESPYHKEELADENKKYVLFCAAGWRSALAAKSLVDMGFKNIAHVDGGFAALKQAGAPISDKK